MNKILSDKTGSILMISLWVLSLLVIFAIGIGHRASINLKLARYQRERVKAELLANNGIKKAVLLLNEDGNNEETKNYDTLDKCGVILKDEQTLESIFTQEWDNGSANFKVGYNNPDTSFIYGLRDEERYLNINGFSSADAKFNQAVLKELFKSILDNDTDAQELADIVIDWINSSSPITFAKKEPFKTIEELLPVLEYFYQTKGDSEIEAQKEARILFTQIKDLITADTNNTINLNTVSYEYLRILASALKESLSITDADINDFIADMRSFREENNKYLKTTDIQTSVSIDLGLAPISQKIINQLISLKIASANSEYFRIESTGEIGRVNKKIIAVYVRKEKKFASWHEH
ncbi:MAG: hypothetical protein V2A64_04430 [Candidatus Omnitrophota bacterium]